MPIITAPPVRVPRHPGYVPGTYYSNGMGFNVYYWSALDAFFDDGDTPISFITVQPLPINRKVSIEALAYNIQQEANAGARLMYLCVYSGFGRPSKLICSTGPIPINERGLKQGYVNVTLDVDTYWLVVLFVNCNLFLQTSQYSAAGLYWDGLDDPRDADQWLGYWSPVTYSQPPTDNLMQGLTLIRSYYQPLVFFKVASP